jgi:hypothetical protein
LIEARAALTATLTSGTVESDGGIKGLVVISKQSPEAEGVRTLSPVVTLAVVAVRVRLSGALENCCEFVAGSCRSRQTTSPNRSSGQRPICGLILASVPGMCASPQSAMLESTGSSERPFAVSMYPLRPEASDCRDSKILDAVFQGEMIVGHCDRTQEL